MKSYFLITEIIDIYTQEEIDKCISEIKKCLDEINPYLREDGGEAEFDKYDSENEIVHIKLKGRCDTCPLAMMTLRAGIERYIKKHLPNIKRLERTYN